MKRCLPNHSQVATLKFNIIDVARAISAFRFTSKRLMNCYGSKDYNISSAFDLHRSLVIISSN